MDKVRIAALAAPLSSAISPAAMPLSDNSQERSPYLVVAKLPNSMGVFSHDLLHQMILFFMRLLKCIRVALLAQDMVGDADGDWHPAQT